MNETQLSAAVKAFEEALQEMDLRYDFLKFFDDPAALGREAALEVAKTVSSPPEDELPDSNDGVP